MTPNRSSRITIHELRCLPPSGGQFPWHAIPSLVAASADWIERKSAELAGHTLLLGTTMLPEAALGLGITAGRAQRTRWPENHMAPRLPAGHELPGRAAPQPRHGCAPRPGWRMS